MRALQYQVQKVEGGQQCRVYDIDLILPGKDGTTVLAGTKDGGFISIKMAHAN